MGEQVIERPTFRPAQVRVIREHYPKYVYRTCDRFIQAKVPPRAFDYTKFDDRLIAGLAVSRFADFMPLYRQEQIFKRSGVTAAKSAQFEFELLLGSYSQRMSAMRAAVAASGLLS